MTLPPDAVPETPEETIERLLKSNNRLAQMVKAGSDRLQESARELMAQGWDVGVTAYMQDDGHNSSAIDYALDANPYRQPINLPGATK